MKSDDGVTEVKDEIKFAVETDRRDGLVVEVEYENEIENDTEETETETKYEVIFDRVVEYSKGIDSTSPAYDWETDTIVSELPLEDWESFSDVEDSLDGMTSTFSVQSEGGVATFTFTISRASENEAVTANKMKIDFELIGYPWTRAGTNVALLSTVESTREVEVEYDGKKGLKGSREASEIQISFADAIEAVGGVAPFGDFTWEQEALVLNSTNVTIDVIATSPIDNSNLVAFSFVGDDAQGAGDIYWDPDVGVGYRDVRARTTFAVTGSLIGLAVVGIFAVLIVRRFGSSKK